MGHIGWWIALVAAAWFEVSVLATIVVAGIGFRRRERGRDRYREPAGSSASH